MCSLEGQHSGQSMITGVFKGVHDYYILGPSTSVKGLEKLL